MGARIYQLGKYTFTGATLQDAILQESKFNRGYDIPIYEYWVDDAVKAYLEDEDRESIEIRIALDSFQQQFKMSLVIQEMGYDPDDLDWNGITIKELKEVIVVFSSEAALNPAFLIFACAAGALLTRVPTA